MAKILKIFLILFLLVSLGATTYYATRVVTYTSKASYTSRDVSAENSYVFASPVTARADGVESIRVTIFILNQQGLGAPGLTVSLTSNKPNLKITPISPTTDETGKAYFEITSLDPVASIIVASLESQELNQKITLSFY